MFYTVYKVTNKMNGKVYIGTHKTKNLDDEYMGSGKYLKRAINKHGLDNFEKEILFIFDNSEEMFAKEAELVNEDFLAEANTYNLRIGGFGGWDYINSDEEKRIAKNKKAYQTTMTRHSEKIHEWRSIAAKERIRRGGTHENFKNSKGFDGKKHSEETKKLMSSAAKKRLKDSTANSQYGTQWITDGIKSTKIKKGDPIPSGYMKGRKIKQHKKKNDSPPNKCLVCGTVLKSKRAKYCKEHRNINNTKMGD